MGTSKKLEWDKTGERLYETGVEQCALYVQSDTGTYPKGVAWNGISEIDENPSGAEESAVFADNMKYLSLYSAENMGGTINAYTYPDEFGECIGESELTKGAYIGQQTRKAFGLAYKTKIGNDVKADAYGYKLHLVYGARASVSEKTYNTINDSPEAMSLSWEYSTTPVNVTGHNPTAIITIDSTKCDPTKLAALETILYGSENADARLPLPDEVATTLAAS